MKPNYSIARLIKSGLVKSMQSVPRCFTLSYIQSVIDVYNEGKGNYNLQSVQYVKHGCEYCIMLELISEYCNR